jgi:hypothetical protein
MNSATVNCRPFLSSIGLKIPRTPAGHPRHHYGSHHSRYQRRHEGDVDAVEEGTLDVVQEGGWDGVVAVDAQRLVLGVVAVAGASRSLCRMVCSSE